MNKIIRNNKYIILILMMCLTIILTPIIVYIIARILFPPSNGISKDAWVSFWGSCLSGILGGTFSVIGVFFTLRYYRKKDNEDHKKYEVKNKEEKEFIKNSRILNVKPFLRILTHLKGNIDEYEQINVKLKFDNSYERMIDKSFDFALINGGMGTALNVKCKIIACNCKVELEKDKLISLGNGEVYAYVITIYKASLIKIRENIDFVFEFNDIFYNKYTQKINTVIVWEKAEPSLVVKNICNPDILKIQ